MSTFSSVKPNADLSAFSKLLLPRVIMKFFSLFGRLKSVVIGMVHVKALPGTPLSSMKMSEITEEACREAEIYSDAGVDGLIIENMHDIPYIFSVGPEVTACMTVVCSAVRNQCPFLPLGVQILSSANHQALAVALASGLDFIRAEGFVFSHVADEGLLNACAGELLRYRKQIGAEHVHVFTDIKKKHRCEHCRNSSGCRVLPVRWTHYHRKCHWSAGRPTATQRGFRVYEDTCSDWLWGDL
ncbi:uncharacterized protein F13E9.13, mitochondrial isoform X2 [Periophthalmus magnuspinnatus]|uniref:uncharacterized protein F13E9.13, mitochondrial isoform X2 n=1 Tax=Periophthalmus magnuspinnatus TaxID=409849 RepID=UPI0024367BD2|nr:uncharacterized protein F13E9.13, mitochondrial isoform X2 [Periophthalmus magnuspinnatus]